MRYQVWEDVSLIVTKPDGKAMIKKVLVYVDSHCDTLGFRYMEAGALQDWSFDLRLANVRSFVDGQLGRASDTLPGMH